MRLVRPTAKACDRARSYASLRVDGELSELERRLLATHLEGCAACAAFGQDVEAFTRALRAAALEPLPRPVTISLPARRLFRPLQVGAAALVLAALSLGGLIGATAPGGPERREATVAGAPTRFVSEATLRREQLLILRTSLPAERMPMAGQTSRVL